MSSRTAALVAAAGEGRRLGKGPKALVTIGGSTLLDLAVAALMPHVDEVVVAVPRGSLAEWPARRYVTYVEGGDTRQASVRAMVGATTADHVLVHDVARPYLPAEVVERVLQAARAHGAATAAMGIADTVVTDDGRELDRSSLLAVQTPQGFERRLLAEAHEAAASSGYLGTDDAGLVRRMGHRVELVEGSPLLVKVTRPEDLRLAEALLALRGAATR